MTCFNRIRRFCYVALLFLCFVPAGCFSKEIVSFPILDSLQKTPESPWTWIRENPQTHRSSDEGLEIQVEPGSLMGEGKGVKNILVRSLPVGAASVQTTVDFEPKLQFEQAGLILYANDDRYIKLVKEFVDGTPWIVMAIEIETKITVLKKVPAPENPVKIGLELNGISVAGVFWDADGKKTEVGSGEFPAPSPLKIGLFTQNGTEGDPRWASFTNYGIFADIRK